MKRILSALLAAVLILSAVPVMAEETAIIDENFENGNGLFGQRGTVQLVNTDKAAHSGKKSLLLDGRGGDAWRTTAAGLTKTREDENPIFDSSNAGKKSISLNLKAPEGKEIFFKLLEDADILITNTRHQSLVKLGIDYNSIKDRFPRLIYATLTGYGYEGPDCDAPGFDNIAFWSRPGFLADMMIDSPGSYPVNSRAAMGDIASGSLLFGSVMTAL